MTFKERLKTEFQRLNASETLLDEVLGADESLLLRFVEWIDSSNFSLEEWCQALIVFKTWEESQGRYLPLSHKLEYLSCCSEGGTVGGKLLSLPDVLSDFLKLHGVEP